MEEEKGFVIKDKRAFSSETGGPDKEKPQDDQDKAATNHETATPEAERKEEADAQLPEVNFSTFIFSLSSSALLHFGEIPDPTTGSMKKNLPLAKHSIDILSMLEEKTRGNLSEDEKQLVQNILYDLRMRYVKETR